MKPPVRFETRRLTVRCWTSADILALESAIFEDLPHLQQWLAWARTEPISRGEREQKLRGFERDFSVKSNFRYGLFDKSEKVALGGLGLRPNSEMRSLELGYWLRRSRIGKGLMTEAVAGALIVFSDAPEFEHFWLRCDHENYSSLQLAKRLKFKRTDEQFHDGRRKEIWSILAADVRSEDWP